jgi:23S rRNA (cytidine1920-2'-O)/16S rRNA (cytidine1409-2'-O)-methyltransferase
VRARLDQVLVERGLCDSREKAKRAIMAGAVRVNGQVAAKASEGVRDADNVELAAGDKFVGRGGHKLEHALEHFQINAHGLTAIDLGASTGGFTDCLLQRGAARVFAVDVGQGQLAWKLRQDPRVVVMEKTNARTLTAAQVEAVALRTLSEADRQRSVTPAAFAVDLVVIDCSFISLRKILPPAIALVRPLGNVVALIKPQFEAGKEEADRGAGVISDPEVHARVLRELEQFVGEMAAVKWRGVTESPLLGPAGNKEFLVLIEKSE